MILQVQDTIAQGVEVSRLSGVSIWFWIALIELIIILYFILQKRKKVELSDPIDKIKGAKKNKVDMDDLMMSITNSRELYKKLSKKYHPDRFINTRDFEVAQEIFKDISMHKRNYTELKKIEIIAIEKLGK
jgi:hypothetical protein